MFPVRRGGSLQERVSFKLRQASSGGGHQLAGKLLAHQPNPVLQVEGSVGSSCVTFMIDSRAAVSAIDQDMIPQDIYDQITPSSSDTIGANGIPLDVVGRIPLEVTLRDFRQTQDFVVVRNLSVGCLLGADFLCRHGAIVDCTSR